MEEFFYSPNINTSGFNIWYYGAEMNTTTGISIEINLSYSNIIRMHIIPRLGLHYEDIFTLVKK